MKNDRKMIEMIGKRFGRLVVVKRGENLRYKNTNRTSIRWWCLCDCQLELPEEDRKLKLILGESLRSGKTQSCGCLNKEIISKCNSERRKLNKYDLSGEYGIGWTSNTNKEFYFDLEDYDKIKEYTWSESNENYIESMTLGAKQSLHRIVMNVIDSRIQVDHIHGNKTRNDNRKSNLRLVDNSKNQMNRDLQSNNKSGVTGVYWHKATNKWSVQININQKQTYLGEYKDFDEAVKIRKEAEKKYYGEYSYEYSQAI